MSGYSNILNTDNGFKEIFDKIVFLKDRLQNLSNKVGLASRYRFYHTENGDRKHIFSHLIY